MLLGEKRSRCGSLHITTAFTSLTVAISVAKRAFLASCQEEPIAEKAPKWAKIGLTDLYEGAVCRGIPSGCLQCTGRERQISTPLSPLKSASNSINVDWKRVANCMDRLAPFEGSVCMPVEHVSLLPGRYSMHLALRQSMGRHVLCKVVLLIQDSYPEHQQPFSLGSAAPHKPVCVILDGRAARNNVLPQGDGALSLPHSEESLPRWLLFIAKHLLQKA